MPPRLVVSSTNPPLWTWSASTLMTIGMRQKRSTQNLPRCVVALSSLRRPRSARAPLIARDVALQELANYAETEMTGAAHVRYDVARGVWRIRVLHFSRYNLRGMKRSSAGGASGAHAAAAAGEGARGASREPASAAARPPARGVDDEGGAAAAAPRVQPRTRLSAAAAATAAAAAADASMVSDGDSEASAGPTLGLHELDESVPGAVEEDAGGPQVKRPRTALGVLAGVAPDELYKMQSVVFNKSAPPPPPPPASAAAAAHRGAGFGGATGRGHVVGRVPVRTMAQVTSPGPIAGAMVPRPMRHPANARAAASAAAYETIGVAESSSHVAKIFSECARKHPVVGKASRGDPSLSCGRSFRASFGPNGELVVPRLTSKEVDGRLARVVTITPAACTPSRGDLNNEHSSRESTLTALRNNRATYHGSADSLRAVAGGAEPTPIAAASFDDVVKQLHEYATAAERAARDVVPQGSMAQRWCVQSARTWRLVNALWGSEMDHGVITRTQRCLPAEQEYEETLFRRECVARWLQDALAEKRSTRAAVPGASASVRVWEAVVDRRLADAAQAALAANDYRLAVLLTQAGTDSEAAEFVHNFVRHADERDASGRSISSRIDVLRMNVYRLLARDIAQLSATETLALSWEQALGVHLWYGVHPAASLREAVASFEGAVDANRVATPLPWYSRGAGMDRNADGGMDGCYALLNFAASVGDERINWLIKALSPGASSPDALDYELSVRTAWPCVLWFHAPCCIRLRVRACAWEFLEVCAAWAR